MQASLTSSISNFGGAAGAANPRALQLATEADGRQVVRICPDLQEYFGEVMQAMATSQTVDRTFRNASTLWITAYTNPEYVTKVNAAVDMLSGVVRETTLIDGKKLSDINVRVRNLFLARAVQWIEEIKRANEFSGIRDFEERKLQALQDRLIRQGASREYFKVVNFFEGIAGIAFQDSGPCFRYPTLSHVEELKGTDPNGILMLEGGQWLLASVKKQPDQRAVLEELNHVVDAFRSKEDDTVAANLSNEELLLGFAIIGQVMTNYLQIIDTAPRVSDQVFRQLNVLQQLLSDHLERRNFTTTALNAQAIEDFKDTFGVLSNVLRKESFAEMYEKGEKTALLQAADAILSPFITYHLNPQYMSSNHDWVTIGEDKKAGISVFKTPGHELAVFFNGHNSFWQRKKFNAFSFAGGRGTEFGELQGLVHQHSLDGAKAAKEALVKILAARKDQVGEVAAVRFAGYGLDGSIAQLVGYDYKKLHSEENVLVIGCGVPPFLDETAAADMGNTMRGLEGFQCLNYAMSGDPNMKNLGMTGPLGMRYDNSSFVTVPVPQGVLFASERMTGDTRKDYLQMLPAAQLMHCAMRGVYVQSERCFALLSQLEPRPQPEEAIEAAGVSAIEDGKEEAELPNG